MTRSSTPFQLGEVISGEPHLYVANPPAPPADSFVEQPPASEPKETSPLRRFATWCVFVVGHGALAAAFDKALRP